MKLVITLIITLVTASMIFFGLSAKNHPATSSVTPSPVGQFSLMVMSSGVSLKTNGQSAFTTITQTTAISQGSEIKTDSTGRARLLYPNGTSAVIEENSDVQISDLSAGGNQSRLTLIAGGIWAKIKRALGVGDYYEIETQDMVASVRGTIFGVQHTNNRSNLYVIEHTVSVKAKDPQSHHIMDDSQTDINSGEKITVDATTATAFAHAKKKLIKELMTDNDMKQPIIERNMRNLDEEDKNNEQVKQLLERLDKIVPETQSPIESLSQKPNEEITTSPITTTLHTATPTPVKIINTSPIISNTLNTNVDNGQSTAGTSTATPTPTPTIIKATITSVTPKSLALAIGTQNEFVINGTNLTGIKQVLLGATSIHFFTIDSLSIFADIPADTKPGTYDVSVVTSSGTLTLPQALEVQ